MLLHVVPISAIVKRFEATLSVAAITKILPTTNIVVVSDVLQQHLSLR